MTLMSKHRIVMERITYPDGEVNPLVIFAADAGGEIFGAQRSVSLHRQDWADMGSPEVLTVTVEPGDHLNGEG